MDNIKLFAKMKTIGDFDTNNKNIQPGYWNKIWLRKNCHAYIEKWGKKEDKTRHNWMGKVNPLGTVQEIEIWPDKQNVMSTNQNQSKKMRRITFFRILKFKRMT